MEQKRQVTILIAEDDDGHARLLQEHIKSVGISNPVIRFKDGQEAWDFLSGKSDPCLEPDKAYLLLLDIRMPGLDGMEVLRRVKTDRRVKAIPVVMVSTTDDPRETARCRELGSCACLVKPIDLLQLGEAIRRHGISVSLEAGQQGGKI